MNTTREQEIKRKIQTIINELDISKDEIDNLNLNYDFIYLNNEEDDEDDFCPDCGKLYEDCTCDEDEYEYEYEYENNYISQSDADDIAADEYAKHEFELFKKNNNNKPQKGL